jgi:hypothetical protein
MNKTRVKRSVAKKQRGPSLFQQIFGDVVSVAEREALARKRIWNQVNRGTAPRIAADGSVVSAFPVIDVERRFNEALVAEPSIPEIDSAGSSRTVTCLERPRKRKQRPAFRRRPHTGDIIDEKDRLAWLAQCGRDNKCELVQKEHQIDTYIYYYFEGKLNLKSLMFCGHCRTEPFDYMSHLRSHQKRHRPGKQRKASKKGTRKRRRHAPGEADAASTNTPMELKGDTTAADHDTSDSDDNDISYDMTAKPKERRGRKTRGEQSRTDQQTKTVDPDGRDPRSRTWVAYKPKELTGDNNDNVLMMARCETDPEGNKRYMEVPPQYCPILIEGKSEYPCAIIEIPQTESNTTKHIREVVIYDMEQPFFASINRFRCQIHQWTHGLKPETHSWRRGAHKKDDGVVQWWNGNRRDNPVYAVGDKSFVTLTMRNHILTLCNQHLNYEKVYQSIVAEYISNRNITDGLDLSHHENKRAKLNRTLEKGVPRRVIRTLHKQWYDDYCDPEWQRHTAGKCQAAACY